MNWIWSNFDPNSENSQKLIRAKQENGPDFWKEMREVLDYDLKTLPMARFRFWAYMHIIPLVTTSRSARFIGAAFTAAYKDPIVHDALIENWVGAPSGTEAPFRVVDDFSTSAQRCQDVAHLTLNDFWPTDLKKYKRILEIGGGYGNMCSVVHDMGFEGEYTLFDFPEVHKVQEYYLTKNGLNNIKYVANWQDLETYDLVIATWSLSEIPLELRENVMSKINDSKDWLVTYQENAFSGTLDNSKWFREKFEGRNPEFTFIRDVPYDGKNLYMKIKS
jgi:hypothetical protein